jgi:hypothetical protein
MGFVLGCCLGRPPPARACTNRGNLLSQITASGEPQGLVRCPAKCAHGRSSNGKRSNAIAHKHQPPRAPVCHRPKPLPVGVTGRNIEDTQPLPPHLHPKHPKTAPRPVPPTGLNTPHRASTPAPRLHHACTAAPRLHHACTTLSPRLYPACATRSPCTTLAPRLQPTHACTK